MCLVEQINQILRTHHQQIVTPGQAVKSMILNSLGISMLNHLGINPDTLKHSQLSHWQRVQYRAVINWLTKYKPSPNASNLEKVRGHLEAFHHLCELESWEKAIKIFALNLNNKNVELHLQLATWGYYQEQIELYKMLLGKIESSVDIVCLIGLGKASTLLGNYNQALTYYNQGLVITKSLKGLKTYQATVNLLNNISAIHRFLGDYKKSIFYSQKALDIAEITIDKSGKANAMCNLGIAYFSLSDYSKAVEYHKKELLLVQEVNDDEGECRARGNLGNAFCALGNFSAAIEQQEQALSIAQKLEHRYSECAAFGNLGTAYNYLGEYQKAIEFYKQQLELAQETKDRATESIALGNLGTVYSVLNQHEQALDYQKRRLVIACIIGDRDGKGKSLGNIGTEYYALGKYSEAIKFYKQRLAIAKEISDFSGQASVLVNLGQSLARLGRYSEALNCLQLSLKIFNEIGLRFRKEQVLQILIKLCHQSQQHLLAVKYRFILCRLRLYQPNHISSSIRY